jgi:hypothetical protein
MYPGLFGAKKNVAKYVINIKWQLLPYFLKKTLCNNNLDWMGNKLE